LGVGTNEAAEIEVSGDLHEPAIDSVYGAKAKALERTI
jgi:hypothetical protein